MKYKENGGYVDKVLITTTDNEYFLIKAMVRDMRVPELGDKFSSRHGKMMELLAGKAGLYDGERKFGTIFGGTNVEDCAEILVQHGFSYCGKDVMYSGTYDKNGLC